MSLATRLTDLSTRISTEFKSLRTLINGNQADLSSLNTSAKSNLVAAINETLAMAGSGGATQLTELTDVTLTSPTTGHVLRHDGTKWVNVVGTDVFDAAGAAAAAAAGSQPLDSDLTAIAALTTTSYGRAVLELANQAALMALMRAASDTQTGIVELATTAEAQTGTDTARAVTPAALKAVADTKQSTSEKGVAGGYAGLDGGGKIPIAQMPTSTMTYEGVWNASTNSPSLSDGTGDTGQMYRVGTAGTRDLGSGSITFAVGDYVIYNSADKWEKSDTTDAVSSVAGKTGDVTLAKGDVGLGNVDNTSDANKPVSTAQQTALNGKQNLDATLTALAALTTAANQVPYSTGVDTFSMTALTAFGRSLIDDADATAGRATLSVYSQADIGNPETDLVAVFTAGLV